VLIQIDERYWKLPYRSLHVIASVAVANRDQQRAADSGAHFTAVRSLV
jgi:hypothetical protein